MSEQDQGPPSFPLGRLLLCLLTFLVLLCIIPQALSLSWTTFYRLMRLGVSVPQEALDSIVYPVWAMLGALIFVNLC